jgi:hypothetical protein
MIGNAPHILWSKSCGQNPFSYTLTVKKEVLINSINFNKQCQAIFGGGKLGVVPVPNNKKMTEL